MREERATTMIVLEVSVHDVVIMEVLHSRQY